jgi:2-methylcitrate dehydratase PrpD
MIRAYVAGYEVWAELIFRERGNYQRKGWHPTGIFGAVGAAAACAVLRGLPAEAAAHALGIAASEASGVVSNMGAMVKPTHPGHAAACGIMAARFAANGVTAAHDALEHEQGFLRALSPAGDVDLDTPMTLPPARWRLLEHGLAIKKYPVCYRAHRAIDGMLDLLGRERVETAAIRGIAVTFSPTHALILKHHRPQTALEGKFSIEFALACAIAARRVGLRDLTDAFVSSPAVQDLMAKVVIEIDPVEEPGTSGYAPFDTVRLELADGRTVSGPQVRHARGDAALPLMTEDLWIKFEDCAGWSGLPLQARPLFDRLQQLETCASASDLFPSAPPVVPLRTKSRRSPAEGRRTVQ